MPKIKQDIYKFGPVDTDIFLEAAGFDDEIALDYAIDAARERARLYVIPCAWLADFSEDHTEIIVKRIRHA